MKNALSALLIVLTITPFLHSAEESNQAEEHSPFTKLFKRSDFETNGNWVEEEKNVL